MTAGHMTRWYPFASLAGGTNEPVRVTGVSIWQADMREAPGS